MAVALQSAESQPSTVPLAGGVHLVLSGGLPIALRESGPAEVFLGCLTDGGGKPRRALEIWMQRVEEARGDDSLSWVVAGALNRSRDEAWARETRWWQEEANDGLWLTGREDAPQPPVWIAKGRRLEVPPMRIERDTSILAAAGLPAYDGTPRRFLAVETADGTAWLELTGDHRSGAQWSPPKADAVFNPRGGHLRVRLAAEWSLRDFGLFLSTGIADEATRPRSYLPLRDMPSQRDMRAAPNLWLRGWQGSRPPLSEILHLKLGLVLGLIERVEVAVRSRHRPFLNLETDSFDVAWSGWEAGLALWSGRPVLIAAGAAEVWPPSASGDDPVFVLPVDAFNRSVYRHPSVQPPRSLSGAVRLRDVRPDKRSPDGDLLAEGTLLFSERLPDATDWILIQCPWSRNPLQATVTSLDAARGEVLFVTAPWRPAPEFASLGTPGGRTPRALACHCAILPRLNLPADLYSLGIIALEILCGNSGLQALPRVVDESLRLVQRLDQAGVERGKVPDTLAVWARKEAGEAWTLCLNPAQLVVTHCPDDLAWSSIPPECWFAILEWCFSLLTGQWSQARFAGAGEGSSVAPHADLERPLADLRQLLARTRAMACWETEANREIRSRIEEMMRA